MGFQTVVRAKLPPAVKRKFLLPEISLGWLDKILTKMSIPIETQEYSVAVIDLDLLAFYGRFAMASNCQQRGHTSAAFKIHFSPQSPTLGHWEISCMKRLAGAAMSENCKI